jgi:hypothetical protein
MKFLQKIIKYFTLNKEERILFHQALQLLIAWKIRIVFLPMRKYVKFLGEKGKEAIYTEASKENWIRKLPIAIHRADSILPWKSKCLTEAIATKKLLEKYQIKSTLFLGVAKDENQKLIAHAWLRWGEKIISGERGYEKFTIVEKFA